MFTVVWTGCEPSNRVLAVLKLSGDSVQELMRSIVHIAKTSLTLCLIGLLVLGPVGCSGFALVTSFQPTNSVLTVSGVVSIVQITTIQGPAGITTITVVTFIQQGSASTIKFCGNIASQLVVNAFVTVNFTQGQSCGNVVTLWTAQKDEEWIAKEEPILFGHETL